ncbi:hypothetical protein [Pannonibacter phragmitetus]|uniref:hypothetical protein n=1 Tax=Pannonibacter phragmitetus TaxID=121719 RepID=UPI003D2F0EA9
MTILMSSTAKRLCAATLLLAVAACNQTAPTPRTVTPSVPGNQTLTPAPKVPADQATFAFEPFTGAPGNTADELAQEIGTRAGIERLKLVRRVDAKPTYRVKGYLTATGTPAGGSVFFVFDVFDANGVRLTRISGTEAIGGVSGDPWMSVSTSSLQQIASRAVLELKAWVNTY